MNDSAVLKLIKMRDFIKIDIVCDEHATLFFNFFEKIIAWHGDQISGLSGKPYAEHLAQVASLVLENKQVADLGTLCIAVGHDVLEDTGIDPKKFETYCYESLHVIPGIPRRVVTGIRLLTDRSHIAQTGRLEDLANRLEYMPVDVFMVKVADTLDNVRSVIANRQNLCPNYVRSHLSRYELYAEMYNALMTPDLLFLKPMIHEITELIDSP